MRMICASNKVPIDKPKHCIETHAGAHDTHACKKALHAQLSQEWREKSSPENSIKLFIKNKSFDAFIFSYNSLY